MEIVSCMDGGGRGGSSSSNSSASAGDDVDVDVFCSSSVVARHTTGDGDKTGDFEDEPKGEKGEPGEPKETRRRDDAHFEALLSASPPE